MSSLPSLPKSSLLEQLLHFQNLAYQVISQLSPDIIKDLSLYYNHALISKRAVVTDVEGQDWCFDLASSLAAVLFARTHIHVQKTTSQTPFSLFHTLIHILRHDVNQSWFHFAVRNARKPTMISMPSLPALNLGVSEERFYVQSVSDSWPSKSVSHLSQDLTSIIVNPTASRRFVDGMVAGDLGGERIHISDHERSFIGNHSIGWISRYEQPLRTVTIIEVDPLAKAELCVDIASRRQAHDMVKVAVQSLDMYTISMKMHEDPSFAENFVLSRLLTIDQLNDPIDLRDDDIEVSQFIHVHGSASPQLLGAVDEEAFLRSLGSLTAKNKVRSALAISAKARLVALRERGSKVLEVSTENVARRVKNKSSSRMIRCGADGIYVWTRVPYDTVLVLCTTVGLTVWACQSLVMAEGESSIGEASSFGLALIIGICVTYHNIRYNSWPIGQTVRLKRMCHTDEEMQLCMSSEEVIETIAEAGAKGAGMDGILTCAYSKSTDGKFSVTKPLALTDAARAGLKLRLSTELKPLWIDRRGVRVVTEEGDMWHASGDYVNRNYLEFTSAGPSLIGGLFRTVRMQCPCWAHL